MMQSPRSNNSIASFGTVTRGKPTEFWLYLSFLMMNGIISVLIAQLYHHAILTGVVLGAVIGVLFIIIGITLTYFYQTLFKVRSFDRSMFQYVANKKELRKIWDLDTEAYGSQNVSWETLLEWWNQNSQGIYTCQKGEEIRASFGIWPVTNEAYSHMVGGTMPEKGLTKEHILTLDKEKGHQYWHITGYFETSIDQKKTYEFLAACLQQMVRRVNNNGSVKLHISFYPLNDRERILLDILGFMEVQYDPANNLKIWVYVKDMEDLQSRIDFLSTSVSNREFMKKLGGLKQ